MRDVGRLLKIAGNADVPNHLLPHRVMPAPRRVDFGPEPFDWSPAKEDPPNVKRAGGARGPRPPGVMALQEFGINDAKKMHRLADVSTASCCFDRGRCTAHRSHWKGKSHAAVEFFQIADPASGGRETDRDSFALVAGEGNFLRQQFRVCRMHPDRRSRCGAADSPAAPSPAELAAPVPGGGQTWRRRRRPAAGPPVEGAGGPL